MHKTKTTVKQNNPSQEIINANDTSCVHNNHSWNV